MSRKRILGLCFAALSLWAFTAQAVLAQDLGMDDLAVASYSGTDAQPAVSRGATGPDEIFAKIEQVLNTVYEESGNRYVVQVTAKTEDDTRLSGLYDNANSELKTLWSQLGIAVKNERRSMQSERDARFKEAMETAFAKYRSLFTGKLEDFKSRYAQLAQKARSDRFKLRWDKKWLDKKVKLSSYTPYAPSSHPDAWDDNEALYALGLLPPKLLEDINESVDASALYGYIMACNSLGYSPSEIARYGRLSSIELNPLIVLDDSFYYGSIYGHNFIRLRWFKGTQPVTTSLRGFTGKLQASLDKMSSALEKAAAFSSGRSEISMRDGEMVIGRGTDKGTAKSILAEYKAICEEFRAACGEFADNWTKLNQSFPGAATMELQKAFDRAFSDYKSSLEYNKIDEYGQRFKELAAKSSRFKLERKSNHFLVPAIDKSLYTPSSWSMPRKSLYSPQRVIANLPSDLQQYIIKKKQEAFSLGALKARRDYQAYIDAQNAANSNDGYSGSSSGGSWNDSGSSHSGGSWNDR